MCGSDDNDIHAWDTLKTTYNGKIPRFHFVRTDSELSFILVLQGHCMPMIIESHRFVWPLMERHWRLVVGIISFVSGVNLISVN